MFVAGASRRALAANGLAATRYLSQLFPPAAVLGVLPALHRWRTRRPPINAAWFVAGSLVDDLAYGAGVWAGAIRHRTATPLRPTVQRPKERPDG
jgi:hypothetical protein